MLLIITDSKHTWTDPEELHSLTTKAVAVAFKQVRKSVCRRFALLENRDSEIQIISNHNDSCGTNRLSLTSGDYILEGSDQGSFNNTVKYLKGFCLLNNIRAKKCYKP